MKMFKLFWRCLFIALTTFIFFSCQKEEKYSFFPQEHSQNFINLKDATDIASVLKFEQNGLRKTGDPSINQIGQITPIIDNKNVPAFYVINYQNGGFLLLSADNRVKPILAYSEDAFFDVAVNNQPLGLFDWQANVTKNIEYIRENNLKQTNEIKYQWDNLTVFNKEDPIDGCENQTIQFGPLINTTWGQGCGYNTYMPATSCTGQCSRYLAGCVPVAIAQVMKYHQYPSSYNWANMPNGYGTNTTASFIKDIHNVIPIITYNCTATSVADTFDFVGIFKNSFGYSTAIQANYNKYTLKQELEANRPVILTSTGGANTGGHMWVCEGTRSMFA